MAGRMRDLYDRLDPELSWENTNPEAREMRRKKEAKMDFIVDAVIAIPFIITFLYLVIKNIR